MKHILLSVSLCVALAGCGDRLPGLSGLLKRDDPAPEPAVAPVPLEDTNAPIADVEDVTPISTEVVADDTPTPADAPAAPSGDLGTTIASLGSAAEPGLWLKTPLVSSTQPGKVTYKGKTIDVTLIPISGPATSGSRMSLQAFQALGADLTGLPEVAVSV